MNWIYFLPFGFEQVTSNSMGCYCSPKLLVEILTSHLPIVEFKIIMKISLKLSFYKKNIFCCLQNNITFIVCLLIRIAYLILVFSSTWRRGDQQMKLPCSHVYHGECITKWLSINKVYIFKSIFFFWSSLEYVFIFCCPHLPSFQKCPVCNTEVFGEESTH